jgi:hypothetical protein
MSSDFFKDYPSSRTQGGQRATNGGKQDPKPLPYSTPVGPKSIGNSGPGLGGDSYGNGQQPVCRERPSGSPGIGGSNHGNAGTQGKR